MARPRFRDVLVVLPLVVATTAIAGGSGCSGTDRTRPGESVGAFHVTSTLVSSTCGQPPDPWEFDVRLRHDATNLYWVQGDAPIAGQVDATASVSLKSTVVSSVRAADPKTQTAACNMSRTDVVALTLAPVASPAANVAGTTSFKGSLAYRFAATEGSSCEDQLVESGGGFATLPCDVMYELTAVRTGDAK
jgi:hypothetical protein